MPLALIPIAIDAVASIGAEAGLTALGVGSTSIGLGLTAADVAGAGAGALAGGLQGAFQKGGSATSGLLGAATGGLLGGTVGGLGAAGANALASVGSPSASALENAAATPAGQAANGVTIGSVGQDAGANAGLNAGALGGAVSDGSPASANGALANGAVANAAQAVASAPAAGAPIAGAGGSGGVSGAVGAGASAGSTTPAAVAAESGSGPISANSGLTLGPSTSPIGGSDSTNFASTLNTGGQAGSGPLNSSLGSLGSLGNLGNVGNVSNVGPPSPPIGTSALSGSSDYGADTLGSLNSVGAGGSGLGGSTGGGGGGGITSFLQSLLGGGGGSSGGAAGTATAQGVDTLQSLGFYNPISGLNSGQIAGLDNADFGAGSGSGFDLSGVGNFLKDNKSTLLPAAGLAYQALTDNGNITSQYKNAAALQQQANALTAEGQQGLGYSQTGTLPAGAQTSLDQALTAAQAHIRSQFASMGLSGSTMETTALNNAAAQTATQRFQMSQQLAQQGLQEIGAGNNLNSSLLNLQMQQDQNLSNAIGKFVTAIAGGGASTNQTYKPAGA